MKYFISCLCLLLIVTLSHATLTGYTFFTRDKNKIHIAVVVPVKSAAGRSHIRGIQLHVDEVNKKGGMGGRKIALDIYDDANSGETARKKALEIARNSRAVVVIGHISSAISVIGGEIYKEHQIPALAPSSTSDQVTLGNDWYFRTVFNNSFQGRFLAYYVQNVLNRKSVCIIREDSQHSSGIAEVFKSVAESMNLPVKYDRVFQVEDQDLDTRLTEIVGEIKSLKGSSAIFIGAHAREGAKIIKRIREAGLKNPVIGPTAFATREFKKAFERYPLERSEPGYYTNGLYVGVPLIFDTANEMAQNFKKKYLKKYREVPDWQAAYSYDTAMVALRAIEDAKITGDPETLARDRHKIRTYLASLSSTQNAVAGTTGLNFFDENGDCPKPITIGIYRHRNIISAQAQLQTVLNRKLIPDMEAARKKGYILPYKEDFVYKTNVVYAGVEMGSIDELDLKKSTSLLDFHIWFRYQGEFEAQDIVFLNSVEKIRMPSPSARKKTLPKPKASGDPVAAELVKKDTNAGLTSLLYHVRARFRNDFDGDRKALEGFHQLGFKFRHRNLSRNNLIYVTDVIGMGLTGKTGFLEKMKTDAVLAPEQKWKLDEVRFFQNNALKSSRGDLRYLDVQNKFIECSQFNMEIMIKEDRLSLRRKIPDCLAPWLSVIGIAFLLLLVIFQRHQTLGRFSKSIWLFQVLFVFLLLLSSEGVLLSKIAPDLEFQHLKTAMLSFDIFWWVVPAFFLHLGLQPFVYLPMEKQTGYPTPKVMRRLPAYTIYLVAGYGIITFVFDQNITKLMATSGVAAMVVGFLVKDNISNFFASISILQGYQVRTGQWVRVSGFDEGKVEDVTKLATRIRTRDGGLLNIPNSIVLSSTIRNYGYPEDIYWQDVKLETVSDQSPNRVIEVLKAAIDAPDEILKSPEPVIVFKGQGDSSAIYTVRYAVKDYSRKNDHLTAAWTSVWRHLDMAGIELATPHRIIRLHKENKNSS